MINVISAALFKNMVLSAANKLSENKDKVDALNVFPVPDGDTGTNMGLTFMNAAKEIEKNDYTSVSDAAAAVAKATLRGARGNSGVILSQIFRGISKGLKGMEAADVPSLAAALQAGSDTAYSAVMKPTEGTILTVVRKCAAAAADYSGEDMEEFFAAVIKKGNRALEKTTQMLPQLQQAGVVDAGGQGLMFVLQGFAEALDGREVTLKAMGGQKAKAAADTPQQSIKTEDIKYAYCTEFIINKYNPSDSSDKLRSAIEGKGDCMLIIDEEEIVKVHIHTNNPGYVLEQAVLLGEMVNIKIDNMKHQHSNLTGGAAEEEKAAEPEEKEAPEKPAEPEKELAVIAVAAGEGLAQTFRDMGVDGVIEGGQTMNPSTEDILAAADKANAKNVIVLPNNKNIILSAEQAQYLTQRKIFVVPSRSVPEGIAAMMAFDPSASPEELFELMKEGIKTVKSGSVTFAVRDTSIDGMDIAKGNYLGISSGKILSVGEDMNKTAQGVVDAMTDEDSEVISVYFGSDVTEEQAGELGEFLEENYPDADVLIYNGGQPVYYYIISVE